MHLPCSDRAGEMHKVQLLSIITTISLAVASSANAATAYTFTRRIESGDTFSGFGVNIDCVGGAIVVAISSTHEWLFISDDTKVLSGFIPA